MDEPQAWSGAARWPSTVAALVIFAAVGAISYWFDRAYRRWSMEISPYAAPRARWERMGLTYQQRRADTTELAGFTGGLLADLAGSGPSQLTTESETES